MAKVKTGFAVHLVENLLPRYNLEAMRAEWANTPQLPPSRKRILDEEDDESTTIAYLKEAVDCDVGVAKKLKELRGDGLVNTSAEDAESAVWMCHDESKGPVAAMC